MACVQDVGDVFKTFPAVGFAAKCKNQVAAFALARCHYACHLVNTTMSLSVLGLQTNRHLFSDR
jgi:hypothetical protein